MILQSPSKDALLHLRLPSIVLLWAFITSYQHPNLESINVIYGFWPVKWLLTLALDESSGICEVSSLTESEHLRSPYQTRSSLLNSEAMRNRRSKCYLRFQISVANNCPTRLAWLLDWFNWEHRHIAASGWSVPEAPKVQCLSKSQQPLAPTVAGDNVMCWES